jgi:hypothetical protein
MRLWEFQLRESSCFSFIVFYFLSLVEAEALLRVFCASKQVHLMYTVVSAVQCIVKVEALLLVFMFLCFIFYLCLRHYYSVTNSYVYIYEKRKLLQLLSGLVLAPLLLDITLPVFAVGCSPCLPWWCFRDC